MSIVIPKGLGSRPTQTKNLHYARDCQGFLCEFDNYRSVEARSWRVQNDIPRLVHTTKAIRQIKWIGR